MKLTFKCLDCGSVITAPWLKIFNLAEEHQDAHGHIGLVSSDGSFYIQNAQLEWVHVL